MDSESDLGFLFFVPLEVTLGMGRAPAMVASPLYDESTTPLLAILVDLLVAIEEDMAQRLTMRLRSVLRIQGRRVNLPLQFDWARDGQNACNARANTVADQNFRLRLPGCIALQAEMLWLLVSRQTESAGLAQKMIQPQIRPT